MMLQNQTMQKLWHRRVRSPLEVVKSIWPNVGDQPPPVQIARAATPASPGHSELSRMEGGGVVAKWDPDDDELVPDYASMPVVPDGKWLTPTRVPEHGRYTTGRKTHHSRCSYGR